LAQRGMINHLPDKVMDCSPRSCEYANGGHTRFDRPDMRIERHGRRLPYSSEQIFDLAADIERYPQFLRWWISAHIVRREPQLLTVEQVLGVGPVQMRFTSQALLQRPDCLEVRSSDSMFEKFHMRFLVSPQGPDGCSLSIAAELELRSVIQQLVVGAALSTSVDEILSAFEARAHALYRAH
jgi:coenzyme Q-binding protein COQ10